MHYKTCLSQKVFITYRSTAILLLCVVLCRSAYHTWFICGSHVATVWEAAATLAHHMVLSYILLLTFVFQGHVLG